MKNQVLVIEGKQLFGSRFVMTAELLTDLETARAQPFRMKGDTFEIEVSYDHAARCLVVEIQKAKV